jgi:hypothetical protein
MSVKGEYRGVNEAFAHLVPVLQSVAKHSGSRDGNVIMFEDPVCVTYKEPRERVLFNSVRDCNPFFHLYEALWMLAGYNDVRSVSYYNSEMARFSDDGASFHAAYGHRWRNHFDKDQIKEAILHLAYNRESRRVVIAMWDPEADGTDGTSTGKDYPCNTHIYLKVIAGKLRMTVCNRSNDLVWGMLGANMVHMSMLHEYLACCLDLPMGHYVQFTDNLHAYTDRWTPDKWLAAPIGTHYTRMALGPLLVRNRLTFDREVKEFVQAHKDTPASYYAWQEPFLRQVAQPMCAAFHHHKARDYEAALGTIDQVQAEDWRFAGRQWIEKRKRMWEDKSGKHEQASPSVDTGAAKN